MSPNENEQWQDVTDAESAFPSDWRKQCDIAERKAIEDEPASAREYYRARAGFALWLGVYEREKAPKTHVMRITARRALTFDTDMADMGALLMRDDGTEVSAVDVFVVVRCADVRAIVGRS